MELAKFNETATLCLIATCIANTFVRMSILHPSYSLLTQNIFIEMCVAT